MSEQVRCPFCESAIPREALFCSRCGGKLPRPQGTTPGIAPRPSTPPAPAPAPPAAGAAVAPAAAVVAAPPAAPHSSPSPSAMSMSTASQSMSISQIQRPGRGLRIALVVLVAAVCAAGGWAIEHYRRSEPIAAVPAPAVVELGQPRVAVGAELPDPSRFLAPDPSPGGTSPTRPQSGTRVPAAPGGRSPARTPGTPAPPAGGGDAAPSPPPAGDPSPPAGTGPDHPPPANGTPPNPDPSPPPDPGADDPGVPEGQLDTRAVIFVVRHYLPQVRACYERQLRNEPELRGQITMRFTVGAGGRVVDTEVVLNSTGSDPLAACVSSNLRTWRFPEPEGGPVAFEYPFRFGSPGATPALPGATQP